jgi:hypothetical protein
MEIFKAILIHLIVPIAGILWFLKIRNDMLEKEIVSPPTIQLFVVFATYGGVLLVFLTVFFWYSSGMAALGFFYLLFVAPIVMLALAYQLYSERNLSKFHRATFTASVLYPIMLATIIGVLVVWANYFSEK